MLSLHDALPIGKKAVALSDADFALRVAAEVRPSTFHVVGYAMNCSATLSRALHRFAFYCRLISDSATATLTETGDQATLTIFFDTGGEPPIRSEEHTSELQSLMRNSYAV